MTRKSSKTIQNQNKETNNFFMKHIRNFCDKTSLHGLRYVTEENTHWLQSLLWGSFILLGVVFCYILMFLVWTRFDTSPTMTAVETLNYPVWNVPFPSVTICDTNKVHKSRTTNINNILISNGFSEDYINGFFNSLVLLTEPKTKGFDIKYEDIFAVLQSNKYTVESIMLEVMKPCSEFFDKCSWASGDYSCMKLFKTIKTDEGFCCSFNYHHSNETFDRRGVNNKNELKNATLLSVGAGIHTGLSLRVKIDESEYLAPTRTVPSILILVHDNEDYPEMKLLSSIVKKGELLQIPFDPAVIETTEDVLSLDIRKRRCLFDREATISIGKYGYENCIVECRMDTILNKCGCIPFYYNVKYYKNNTALKICSLSDTKCIFDNFELLYTLQLPDQPEGHGMTCVCMPTCDVNWYSYVSDVGNMVDSDDLQAQKYIMIHVYNSEYSCIKYKQSNILTWDGLFASFGGIFGLCLGGSIVSLVEVAYHFTIRLYTEFRYPDQHNPKVSEFGKRKWANYPQPFNEKQIKNVENSGKRDINIMKNFKHGDKIFVKPRKDENDIFVITKIKNM